MSKIIKIEDIFDAIYKGGLKDGRNQVSTSWQDHYDNLINPHISTENQEIIDELNKNKNG